MIDIDCCGFLEQATKYQPPQIAGSIEKDISGAAIAIADDGQTTSRSHAEAAAVHASGDVLHFTKSSSVLLACPRVCGHAAAPICAGSDVAVGCRSGRM